MDDATGRILNTNYTELESCTFAELPPFQTVITETPAPGGPFGASGIGEPAGVPLPQAVVMALYNATGKIIELPATPANILQALGKI
jgi:CO/xanthine dehydrogenase Mo-binding subunit